MDSMNGCRTSGWIVVGQPALALGEPGFFVGQSVAALDFIGQLATAERLLARIDDVLVAQHAERGRRGADVHHRHHVQLGDEFVGEEAHGVLEREGLDVDDLGGQTADAERRHAYVDVVTARGGEHHVDLVGFMLLRAAAPGNPG
ncbi:MAG: hypothetical protein V9G12_24170 [Microthrixaceae bacterium]